ncbi:MAG: integral rane, YjbE family protein, partial [Thermoleophilia bacterium]|nr:integral rane, YjbE family protein [Thermoleophilia bacterium]
MLGLGGVIVADLLLAGDNAVVIALAARNLPPHLRTRAIVFGAGAAIVLRGVLTIAAVLLLHKGLPGVQLAGGLALLWIGWQLAIEDDHPEDGITVSNTLKGAIRTILIADVVMSIDNVLAVSAIARNDIWLVIVGLLVSIPIVMGGASVLLRVIDRFPIFVWAGAALILYVAVELIFVDPLIDDHVSSIMHGALVERLVAAGIALALASLAWSRRPKHDTVQSP